MKEYRLLLADYVSQVAVELDRAAPAALSFSDLAKSLTGVIAGDLHRVRLHEDVKDTDVAAREWIVEKAAHAISPKKAIVFDGEKVSLLEGYTLDDLNFKGSKMYPHAPDESLGDIFNPQLSDAVFAENLRPPGNLDELRESMRVFGWLPHHPAIQDERGVTLVGHRRLAAAEAEGVKPQIVTIVCGQGDAADVERFRLAWASNLGGKAPTKAERTKIEAHLFGRGWTMKRIGEAVGVSRKSVSVDLKGHPVLVTIGNKKRADGRGAKTGSVKVPSLTPDDAEAIMEQREQGLNQEDAVRVALPDRQLKASASKELARQAEAMISVRPAPSQSCTCTCPVHCPAG